MLHLMLFTIPPWLHFCGHQCHLLNGVAIGDQVEMKGDFPDIEVIVDQCDRSDGDEAPDSKVDPLSVELPLGRSLGFPRLSSTAPPWLEFLRSSHVLDMELGDVYLSLCGRFKDEDLLFPLSHICLEN